LKIAAPVQLCSTVLYQLQRKPTYREWLLSKVLLFVCLIIGKIAV
jgi:hypothetical protein